MTDISNEVRIVGDPVLRKKSRPVTFPDDSEYITGLIRVMFEVLDEHEGLGLAAPQVGRSVRLFVALPGYLDDLQGHTVFINPEIEPYGEPVKREEGCLSIPGIYETLERPSRTRVTALDQTGKQFTLDVDGLSARLMQHETDHLNGLLFIDRLSPMKRRFLRRKLKQLMEQGTGD